MTHSSTINFAYEVDGEEREFTIAYEAEASQASQASHNYPPESGLEWHPWPPMSDTLMDKLNDLISALCWEDVTDFFAQEA